MITFNRESILQRSRLYTRTREHFTRKGYLEVETPILADGLIPEPTIEVFETAFIHPFKGTTPRWLVPSPEVHMKQLLAAGSGSIFQISKCFRNSEQIGQYHNPEFSMLEWYTVEADYKDSIAHAEEYIAAVAPPGTPEHLLPPFRVKTMHELWHAAVGLDLDELQDIRKLRKAALSLGAAQNAENSTASSSAYGSAASSVVGSAAAEHASDTWESDTWESLFNRIFLTHIEPDIPQDKPLVITDYPARIECLAANKKGTSCKERWELYAGGIELANCYTEETDADRIEEVFRRESAEAALRSSLSGSAIPDLPQDFPEHFRSSTHPFPSCSGTALGLDRLLLLFGGHADLEGVILFPLSATM